MVYVGESVGAEWKLSGEKRRVGAADEMLNLWRYGPRTARLSGVLNQILNNTLIDLQYAFAEEGGEFLVPIFPGVALAGFNGLFHFFAGQYAPFGSRA